MTVGLSNISHFRKILVLQTTIEQLRYFYCTPLCIYIIPIIMKVSEVMGIFVKLISWCVLCYSWRLWLCWRRRCVWQGSHWPVSGAEQPTLTEGRHSRRSCGPSLWSEDWVWLSPRHGPANILFSELSEVEGNDQPENIKLSTNKQSLLLTST